MNHPPSIELFALPIARHEAGHFVTARIMGFKTLGCSVNIINSSGDHEGYSEIELCRPLDDVENIQEYIAKRVKVLYAGALAQSLDVNGKISNDYAVSIIRKGAKFDYGRARELIQLLRNVRHASTLEPRQMQAELTALDQIFWSDAAKIVEAEANVIKAVAKALTSKVVRFNEKFWLTESEINALPEFKLRFGNDAD